MDLRSRVQVSDGLLIASPEYNYSFTGVLKNALDWASTDTLGNVMAGKAAAIIGASRTRFGTIRSQLHLRQALLGMGSIVIHRPELFISHTQEIIDADGKMKKEYVLKKIQGILAALIKLIEHSDIDKD